MMKPPYLSSASLDFFSLADVTRSEAQQSIKVNIVLTYCLETGNCPVLVPFHQYWSLSCAMEESAGSPIVVVIQCFASVRGTRYEGVTEAVAG